MAASDSALAALPVVGSPVLVLVIGLPLRRARLRYLLADHRFRRLEDAGSLEILASTLTLVGVHDVTMLTGSVRGLARCYRAGTHAVVLIHEGLLHRPDLMGFFVAHEVGHLARNDSALRPVVVSSILAGWMVSVIVWPVAILGAFAVVLLIVLCNHTMELECDRLAARWVGRDRAERALLVVAVMTARIQRGPVGTARSLLTYPPLARRRTAVRRVTR